MLLKELCNASGAPGFEGSVRNIIKNAVKGYADEISVDRMGNIIVHKKGIGKKVAINAHMDEVAFIITSYNEDGTLRFASLGDVENRIMPSKVVLIGEKRIPGVIGLKPIHLQDKYERKKNISYDTCCIDIGSSSCEETKNMVELGDFATFDTEFEKFGEGLIKAKAIDDRAGCAALIEILKEDYRCDLYGIFNVQEEVGYRGKIVSSLNVQPDIDIVIDAAPCGNVTPTIDGTDLILGKGPAVSIMDEVNLAETAKRFEIPYQILKSTKSITRKTAAYGISINIPCRYTHSPVSLVNIKDYENTVKLITQYIKSL